MLRCMLTAKIHGATVTDSNIAYEGSMTVGSVTLITGNDLRHILFPAKEARALSVSTVLLQGNV
jgi:hypothetical protein